MREFFKLDRKPKKTIERDKLFVKSIFCRFFDKKFKNILDKVKHFCRLSGNYLGAAHHSCIDYFNKVNQHKFIPVLYHNFSEYDIQIFFNDLIKSKKNKFKLSVKPATNEEYMCVTYACIKLLDNVRFQQDS